MYENILNKLDSYGPFFPLSVLVDNEVAIRNAVLNVLPGTTTLRDCWFHHKQALWRHLQSEGLASDYSLDGSPIRKSFMMIGAIPYVPVSDVEMAWRFLKPTQPPQTTTFARYYESPWIGTTASPPCLTIHPGITAKLHRCYCHAPAVSRKGGIMDLPS